MATGAEQFNYTMPYDGYFGGVVALSWSHLKLINGFANRFWGWGGEDDDLLARVVANNLTVTYLDEEEGKFQSLKHDHDVSSENEKRYSLLESSNKMMKTDGLNSLRYKLNQIVEHVDYTHIYAYLRHIPVQNQRT